MANKKKKRGAKRPKHRANKTKIPKNLKHSIKKNIHLFNLAGDKKMPLKQRNKIIDTMDKSQVNTIHTIFKLIITGQYPLPGEIISALRRNKKWILKFLKGGACTKKKKILKQSGGFLGLIGKIAIPLLGKLLKKVF